MKPRTYKFTLPYILENWQLGFAISKLQGLGVWDKLPNVLRTKVETCNGDGSALEITKEDCDSLNDDTWTKIAKELNLKWESK